ncbi:hypothetical protein ACFL5V_01630 [Fibrobacterota bacterium]
MPTKKTHWIILLYHDVSWEENSFINRIGGTCPPDIFREHLDIISSYGNIVSIKEGLESTLKNESADVLFSFWFDDGFRGVRKYAMPYLNEFGVTGAISICSKFISKEDLFWRSKLSFIAEVDGMRFLRSKLKQEGYAITTSVRDFVMDNISGGIIRKIDEVYKLFANDIVQMDAFRIFDDVAGIKKLHANGWVIANHTASHFPISENNFLHKSLEEFYECDKFAQTHMNIDPEFWVVPFDRAAKRSEKFRSLFESSRSGKHLVYVGNRPNTRENLSRKKLFRFGAKILAEKEFKEAVEIILSGL